MKRCSRPTFAPIIQGRNVGEVFGELVQATPKGIGLKALDRGSPSGALELEPVLTSATL